MKKKFIPIIIVLAIVVILIAWAVKAYNGLVVKDEACSDFVFVIYEPTDSTGHNEGFSQNQKEN